jgi:type IV secretory pathway VirB2 component (pilin)
MLLVNGGPASMPTGLFSRATIVLLVFLPAVAWADGTMPGVGFLESILAQLSGPVAVVVTGLGIAIAAICWILGNRDGLVKAIYAAVGGGLLFLVRPLVSFLQGIAGH